jgi:penicillin-binding protein 2
LVASTFKDHSGESRLFTDRVLVAGVLVLAALLLVTARLFQLQVESHEHFSTLSKDNRVRIEPLPPTRGLIYDANGILLANNYPSYSL